jgi:transcriptional regulator
MYLPTHFTESRVDVLHALVRAHPLGLLVTQDSGGVSANDVPFLVDPDPAPYGTLRAHVARANPVWREARTDVDSLVVFRGPEAYVSPGWYPSKAEHAKVVPTWNYVVVQARGRLRVVDDAEWLRGLVGRLTDVHESRRADPWKVSDAPDDFVAAMLRAIVGIEIEVRSLIGKWKVSQNRSATDRAGVAEGLAALGGDAAGAMAETVRRAG